MTAPVRFGDGAIVTASADGTPGPAETALSADERAELERLRAEVADLRSQAAAAPVVSDQIVAPPPAARPHRQRWRSVVATLLIVIACIMAPLAGVAVWSKNLITNTDR